VASSGPLGIIAAPRQNVVRIQTEFGRADGSVRQPETDRLPPGRAPVGHIRASRSSPWRHDAHVAPVAAVAGRVVELPVGARVRVGDRVEHPGVDAGVADVDRVAVVGGRPVGKVGGQADAGGATLGRVRRAADPALGEDDDARRLGIGGDANVDADDRRRLNAAEFDVHRRVVCQTDQRLS